MRTAIFPLATALGFGIFTGLSHAQILPEAGLPELSPRQIGQNSGQCQEQSTYERQCGSNYDYTTFPRSQQDRADAVVEQFRFAWDGYYQYAFPHDELRPLNNTFRDSRNGWGLTAIDSLSTAIIMEQQDIVRDILRFVPSVDFTRNNARSPVSTSLFETNIRYLGGLLSAYDLLKGPFSDLVSDDDNVDALLQQAKSIGDTLKFCFNTPTGIPVNLVYVDNQTFVDQQGDNEQLAGLAEIGTLVLEWQRLSDLSGDPQYGELAQRAEQAWFSVNQIWPGLTGGQFNISSGEVTTQDGGWTGGLGDSAYEYLIKMFVYDPDRYQTYRDRWVDAADSTIQHLVSSPSSRPDLRMGVAFSGQKALNYSEQLACFIGGNFLLASTVLGRDEYRDYGLDFSEFCANGYRQVASGLGPLIYSWNLTLLDDPSLSNQSEFYQRAGYFIPDNDYFQAGQSPEAVESWYYAYQTTGDQYWRDVAWAYTLAQNRTTRLGSGFTSVPNVFEEDGGGPDPALNTMQSFMLAEVLKYSYLIQTPKRGPWHVQEGDDKKNEFVYNTEAHPLRVRARQAV